MRQTGRSPVLVFVWGSPLEKTPKDHVAGCPLKCRWLRFCFRGKLVILAGSGSVPNWLDQSLTGRISP